MKKQNNQLFTIANLITFIGFILLFFSFFYLWKYLYRTQNINHFYLSLLLFGFSAFTDYLDGKVARIIEKYKPGYGISKYGEKLDPFRDKLLLGVLFLINWKMALPVVGIELISVFFSGYMINHRHGKSLLTQASRIVTFYQLPMIMFLLLSVALNQYYIRGLFIVLYVLSFTRVLSYSMYYFRHFHQMEFKWIPDFLVKFLTESHKNKR